MKRGWKMGMWVGLFIAGFLLTVFVVQYLWNLLVPEIFGWSAINFYQAFGLLVLCRVLFKGLFFWHRGYWLNDRFGNRHWKSRWNNMSEDERERFKQKMREKCGWYKPKESDTANTQ